MTQTSNNVWTPSPELLKSAYVTALMRKMGVKTPNELRKRSVQDLSAFWDLAMKDLGVEWFKPYDQVLDESQGIEWTKWFVGGQINLTHNCIDRHQAKLGAKTALSWEGDSGETRTLTYREFYEQVNQTANALKSLGVGVGDTVGILMPMIPEVVVQLFACFKIGAVAIPIFSGFGAEAVASRLQDAEVKVLFTSDVSFRRGKAIRVKDVADAASKSVPSLRAKIVFKRGSGDCEWNAKIDHWWHELVLSQPKQCTTLALASEAHSLIIFTSGTTGKPKGAIHTHAGSLATIAKELRYAFNVGTESRFFWFTDIGWMMGPWEMIGVTFFGGTLFLFEGAPDYPDASRLWNLVDRHGLTHLGISPTAIRLLMRSGEEPVNQANLKTLSILGSTGEPWDPESYDWFFKHVGRGRCPIINISGGTEIIGCLLTPFPIETLGPCSLGGPGLGVDAAVFDEAGKSISGGIGHLVCKQPLPSMTKGFLKGRERYLDTYFSRWKGVWYHGDWARIDETGQWYLHGRSDDTIKIGGKRIGPVEFEAVLLEADSVSEAAAVGVPDSLKGEACVCYVVLSPGFKASEPLRKDLMNQVAQALGKSMAPKDIRFVRLLPKTRSAKILRGLIRKIHLGEELGDTGSVENQDALDSIRQSE
jgi:acetyl-CoA synthetase